MNKNFNEWYIDMSIIPQNGQLEKRTASIESCAKETSREQIITITKLYFGLPTTEEEKHGFASLFIANDSSFSARYSEELALLAGATLVEIAETNSTYDSFAELLSITTSFFREPISSPGILDAIKNQFDDDRIAIREESNGLQIKVTSPKSTSNFCKHVEENGWDDTAPTKLVNLLSDFQKSFSEMEKAINELKQFEGTFREDSQILWWMQSKWSDTLNCPLKSIDRCRGCLMLGWESADIIANFPGPYSMEGIIENVLDACKGKTAKSGLSEIVMQTDKRFASIVKQQLSQSQLIDMLPLCKAIISADNTDKPEEWYPKYKKETVRLEADSQLSLFQYSWQMYLERMAARCYDILAG